MNNTDYNTHSSQIDTLKELAHLPCEDLGAWLERNPNTIKTLKDAIVARSASDQGITPDEVKAMSFVLKLR